MKNKRIVMNVVAKKIVFYMILVAIWGLIYKLIVDVLHIWKPYNFPSPIAVCKSLHGLVLDGSLLIGIVATLKRILIGYFISLTFGFLIGMFISKYSYLGDNLNSLILGMQTLPSICWLPFAILWFGINEKAIIFLIVINSSFAISMAVVDGIRNINPIYVKAARTMGAKGLKLYTTVIIPAAIPSIISGMKQGWSFAWRALMAGEMLAASKGLGQILMMGRDLVDVNQVVAVMVTIILICIIFEKVIFGNLEKSIRNRYGLKARA